MDEPTRIDPTGPSGAARRPWLLPALTGAGGFLAGVLLVIALGGGADTTTTTARVTVTASAPATTPGATVITITAVPPLVGERLDTAKARLKAARFDADVKGGGLFGVLRDSNWVVVAQAPAAGTQLRQGSTVHIDIARR